MFGRRPLIGLIAFAAVCIAQQDGSVTGYTDTPVLPGQKWRVHDAARPKPRKVTPGAQVGAAPSDAIVLFDGKGLAKWENIGKRQNAGKRTPGAWRVENGYFEVVGGTGDLVTKEKFGDCQLHIEWAAPAEIKGAGQLRGNSGVMLMSRYEIQVLDAVDNPTYADGQAGSIYGQFPPLVNAGRKAGEWQTYDIFFEAPRFENGKLVKPVAFTVVHNGVLLHHHKEAIGRMAHKVVGTYAPHEAEEPLMLQDHNDKVRYRNVWIRRIGQYDQP